MIMYCEHDGQCRKSVEVCIYLCPKNTKLKCPEYNKRYEEILEYPLKDSYREKYGEPTFPKKPEKKPKVILQKPTKISRRKIVKLVDKKIQEIKTGKRKERSDKGKIRGKRGMK